MSKMNYWNEAWDLNYEVCPCDVDFCNFLSEHQLKDKTIFHFGSGTHHIVGKRNISDNLNNSILCITASPEEYKTYIDLAIDTPAIVSKYKLLFGDIYQLDHCTLPKFDIVTLFHLNEFWSEQNASYGAMDDMSVIYLFDRLLNENGIILFYTRSNGYNQTQHLIDRYISEKAVTSDNYKTLRVIAKGESIPLVKNRGANIRTKIATRRR